jgi:hypothetical protein
LLFIATIDISRIYDSTAILICNVLVMLMICHWIKIKLKVLIFQMCIQNVYPRILNHRSTLDAYIATFVRMELESCIYLMLYDKYSLFIRDIHSTLSGWNRGRYHEFFFPESLNIEPHWFYFSGNGCNLVTTK